MSLIEIKAIVFDLGGVIFEDVKRVAVGKLYKEKGYDRGVIFDLLRSHKSQELRKGNISDRKFWRYAQKNLPEGYKASEIRKYWYDSHILRKDVFNLVKKLSRDYKLFILSGNVKERIDHLNKKYGFKKYFDLEIYSFDYHVYKPRKKLVKALIERSGLKPSEMIYIDDQKLPLKPAKELGLTTILFETGKAKELVQKLKAFGVVLN